MVLNCGIDIGCIVRSTAGRDKGNIFFVLAVENEYVYLVDGNIRKIENPKKKKLKHLELTRFFDENISQRLINKNKITNQDLRRTIKEIQER